MCISGSAAGAIAAVAVPGRGSTSIRSSWMSILKVARMGHPVLRQRARAIEPKELKTVLLQKFIDDMIATMDEYSGVGLAAPQVHEGLRIFVAHLDHEGRGQGEAIAVVN